MVIKNAGYADTLQRIASDIEESNASASELLVSILVELEGSETKVKVQQKKMILESFKIAKFHRDVKNWQHSVRDDFIDSEIVQYNRKLAEMDKINFELEEIEKEYEKSKRQLKLPLMKLLVQTLEKYEDGVLMKFVEEGQTQIDVSEFFSLDTNSDKPLINYEIFSRLVNLEFRAHVERMVIYELLCKIKNDLGATTRKWNNRNTRIEKFFNDDLSRMVDEINKVRQDELEQYEEEEEDEYEEKAEEEKEEDKIENDKADDLDKDHDEVDEEADKIETETDTEQVASPDKDAEQVSGDGDPTNIEDHNDDMNID